MAPPAKKREKSSEGSGEAAEERPREPAAKRRRAAEKEGAPEADEQRERLRRFALENGLLSLCRASTSAPLRPSKTAIKQDGRDIVKKGARKNRFLFALPGLFAPISGGKIGELADLHTKKPVLYIDFPQGRMKLFGTIIYPKNKYLTLQLAKTSKSILCEDWFENMVVFSDAWWIGTKEENPEELKLQFPESLKEVKHTEYDFKGGVGDTPMDTSCMDKSSHKHAAALSPKPELTDDASDDSRPLTADTSNDVLELTPIRHSARTAGKTITYAEASSGDEDVANDSSKEGYESNGASAIEEKKHDQQPRNSKKEVHSSVDGEDGHGRAQGVPSVKAKQSPLTAERSRGSSKSKQGGLVQTTLATLFEKVEGLKLQGNKNSQRYLNEISWGNPLDR
ncbi:DNA-binding protein [Nymphaea thermarum]|nr:DNA-binding protein [Nymphaea thermarum]